MNWSEFHEQWLIKHGYLGTWDDWKKVEEEAVEAYAEMRIKQARPSCPSGRIIPPNPPKW